MTVATEEDIDLCDQEVSKPHVLHIIPDRDGVREVTWYPSNPVEVEIARRVFAELVGAHYLAYTGARNGGEATRVAVFDPHIEELYLAGPMFGG